jgi:opacity protein-like surface antigen
MGRRFIAVLGLLTSLISARPVGAQWSVTPSAGVAVRGRTGYFDPDDAAARRKLVLALAVSRIGRRFGVEAEVAHVGGFLTGRGDTALITRSNVQTVTGSLIVNLAHAGPFRTYAAVGAGGVRVSAHDVADLFPVSEWQLMFNVGAGVQISASRRFSFSADARYFRSRRGDGSSSSIGFGDTFVDFVRLTGRMTIAIGGR